jgi:hypothetical protein
MSTNYQYTPVFSQDADLISEHKKSYLSRGISQGLDDGRQENSYRVTTDTVKGDILEIPNWPGPQTLKKTRMESILVILGYILCLLPPIFFLCKNMIRAAKCLNRANFTFYSASTICYRSTFKRGECIWKYSSASMSFGKLPHSSMLQVISFG